ncbi:ShlB/FhaC/HecB family hemolysin secretion/activation protein [Nitrospira lenta]|uniref:ShlB/FhaC/HecB family hemolysin secretion/activation protein n=1 Tax=Nitrospira lenta TaxID=1436998 RepID=UPI0015E8DBD4|nr:ShlB/FhaC/HecB family hemolysin secretion/activation protein [Nitrospira lenta]
MIALSGTYRVALLMSLALTTVGHVSPYVSLTLAQTVPDAGGLQQRRQQERDQERLEQLPSQTPSNTPARPLQEPAPPSATVRVSAYRFEGNTRLTAEELQAAVAPYIDRQMDLPLLREAAAAVADRYRNAGWVVQTYLPQQDITDGMVLIAIVEATLGQVSLDDPPPTRVEPEYVVGLIDRQLQPGQHLNSHALDRGLLLADDLPGVQVSGALEAGTEPSTTNVRVRTADEPIVHGDLSIDNSSPRATGSIQGLASLRLQSPFHRGDLITVNTMWSEGSQYGRVAYTLPLGRDGWRIGVNGSWLAYRLVTSEFAALDVKGNAYSLGVEASYPLVRTRDYNLYWKMTYDHRHFDNDAAHIRQSDYRINEGSAGLAGNWYENILGMPGATFGSLTLVQGYVDQGTRQLGENPHVEGTFTKLTWYAAHEQRVHPWVSLYGSFLGQKAFSAMDSAERLYIGGPQTVRAYPVYEAGGSTGWVTTGEVRGYLPWGFGLTGFFDAGHVSNQSSIGHSYTLKGGGVTLSWRSPLGLVVQGTWAHRLGDNPNPTAAGKDQDGSLDLNRFWFSASYLF